MEVCLFVVRKRVRDIPKDDKITIPFEYGIFRKLWGFFPPEKQGNRIPLENGAFASCGMVPKCL